MLAVGEYFDLPRQFLATRVKCLSFRDQFALSKVRLLLSHHGTKLFAVFHASAEIKHLVEWIKKLSQKHGQI